MAVKGWARTRDWRLYAAIAAACIGTMGVIGIINAVNVGSGRYATITRLADGQRDLRAQNRQLIRMVENASAQNEQLIGQVDGLKELVIQLGGNPEVVTATPRSTGTSRPRSTSTTAQPRATTQTTRPTPTPAPPQVTTTTRPTTTTTRILCVRCLLQGEQ